MSRPSRNPSHCTLSPACDSADEGHSMLARLRQPGSASHGSGQFEHPIALVAESLPQLAWGERSAPQQDSMPKLLLRVEEAAQLLSLSRNTVYELLQRGDLSSFKIGGCRRIPLAALHAFVARLEQIA